jgi:hypothetical protein
MSLRKAECDSGPFPGGAILPKMTHPHDAGVTRREEPMKRIIGVLVVGAFLLAACGSDDTTDTGSASTTAAEKSTTTEATTTTAAEEPTGEVIFTYFNDEPFVRFVAEIKNPADQTRVGVRTTWKALDANGVIVGTVEDGERAAIPAGGSIFYVGGAGFAKLTGTPASVEFEITDPGTVTDTPPAANATVENPTFERSTFDFYDGARSYDASFVIAATAEVTTGDLDTAVLLRDAAGNIVAADWADTDAMPSELKAGEKANATASMQVATGDPVSIEAYVYG